MNRFLYLVRRVTIILIIPCFAFAQIPNAGFEDWTNGSPDGWLVSNIVGIATPITQTTPSHSGSYALRGEVQSNLFMPILTTDTDGFPVNSRPGSFTGYYKLSPASSSGDRIAVNVILNIGGLYGSTIASNIVAISEPTNDFARFTVPLIYFSSELPSACVVQFQMIGPSTEHAQPTTGSYYVLDDLSFEGTTDVEQSNMNFPTRFELFQNYPNPFNPKTKIKYSIWKVSYVTLKIYDLLGREVQTIVNGDKFPGTYEATFDGSNLSSGVYFYKLQAGGFAQTKKFILSK